MDALYLISQQTQFIRFQGGFEEMKKHGPWTIKERKRVYQSELMKVYEDEVIQPDGEEGIYSTARLTDGAGIMALDEDGFCYFVKEFRYALGREDIEIVGGAIDEEETPLEAARRELREELGIEAAEWTELGRLHHSTSIVTSVSTMFLAQSLKFTKSDRDGAEVIETVKMPFKEAVEKALNGEFVDAESCVLILRAEHHLRKTNE
jgi:8-oxo-dGTP pyrophosphatase MutT (NUDIX family)